MGESQLEELSEISSRHLDEIRSRVKPGQHIAFVFALTPNDAKVTVDAKEVDAYQWLDYSQLAQSITRQEYLELVKALYDEAVELME